MRARRLIVSASLVIALCHVCLRHEKANGRRVKRALRTLYSEIYLVNGLLGL
jgi:hypothetical protein